MKVTESVYALDSTKENYAYVILGEELVLIDAGYPWKGEGILNDLKFIDIKIQDIRHVLVRIVILIAQEVLLYLKKKIMLVYGHQRKRLLAFMAKALEELEAILESLFHLP